MISATPSKKPRRTNHPEPLRLKSDRLLKKPRRTNHPEPLRLKSDRLLDEPGQGRVLVIDGGASLRRALVGGNLAAAGAKNGWAGIVVDGCVRESAELAASAIGIRALALMPLPTEKRQQGQRDIAAQIQGVWVRPGDRLYADEDGIVVLPLSAALAA